MCIVKHKVFIVFVFGSQNEQSPTNPMFPLITPNNTKRDNFCALITAQECTEWKHKHGLLQERLMFEQFLLNEINTVPIVLYLGCFYLGYINKVALRTDLLRQCNVFTIEIQLLIQQLNYLCSKKCCKCWVPTWTQKGQRWKMYRYSTCIKVP